MLIRRYRVNRNPLHNGGSLFIEIILRTPNFQLVDIGIDIIEEAISDDGSLM